MLSINKRLNYFFNIFGHTNELTDRRMAKELKVNSTVFCKLYDELKHCIINNTVPRRGMLILINKIWKKYNNNPEIFRIKYNDEVQAYEDLKQWKHLKK